MADYYPMLARAVTGLDASASREDRRALYERGRSALTMQLRNMVPTKSESATLSELQQWDDAVRLVEKHAVSALSKFGGWAEFQLQISQYYPSKKESIAPNPTESSRTRARLLETAHRREEAAKADRLKAEAERAEELRLARRAETERKLEEIRKRRLEVQSQVDNQNSRVQIPPITVIPEQNLQAIGFSPTRQGPLDLVRDPPDDPYDPEKEMLYSLVRSQLRALQEEIPSQERTQIDHHINDFLDQPEHWKDVEFKKVLWVRGNVIRSILAEHEAAKSSLESYATLPPAVAAALKRPIDTWNVFVESDSMLSALDRARHGPQEEAATLRHLSAAREFLMVATPNRGIATERAASAIDATLIAAERDGSGLHAKSARDLAKKTSQNFFGQVLRRAYIYREAHLREAAEDNTFTAEDAREAAKNANASADGYVLAHGSVYLEFIATHRGIIKKYVAASSQNDQLAELIDALEKEFKRLKSKI